MGTRLKTRSARSHADVAAFFDASAPTYAEQHGEAERLLRYRLELIREAARFRPGDTVLEVGCGTGKATERFAARGLDILAIDPGRKGCKVVVLDPRGELLEHAGIQPFAPQNRRYEAKQAIKDLVAAAPPMPGWNEPVAMGTRSPIFNVAFWPSTERICGF